MMLVYVLSAPCFIWEQAVSITTEEEVRGEKRNIFNVEAEVEVEVGVALSSFSSSKKLLRIQISTVTNPRTES